MAERTTAEERMRRILYILPSASREEGVALTDLARELGVEVETLREDVQAVVERSYYLPPGRGDDVQIQLTAERLTVFTPGPFRRPARLNRREALCLALGLRMVAMESGEDALAAELRRNVEARLSDDPPPEEDKLQIRTPDLEVAADEARTALVEAARARRPCRIRYLKPGTSAPQERTVHPWVIAQAEGSWYAIGHSPEADGIRAFRLDRVLEARPLEGSYEVPADFDVSEWTLDGRVYHASGGARVKVRYASSIARWIEEREEVERSEDGSVTVTYRVTDPGWVVRHVLQYGGAAEVLEPDEIRRAVRETAERIAGGTPGG